MNARIDVSGVRSSCVTVEMKSSFIRSSSCRRSLAARSSAVAVISSCDFCFSSWLYAITCDASSSIDRTSSIDSASSCTVDATMIRAEAPPIAPASAVSANCTRPASAGTAAGDAKPRRRAYSANAARGSVSAQETREQRLQVRQ